MSLKGEHVDWISQIAGTPLELAAVLFSVVCVWLNIKQIIWCWPMAIIASILYFIVFMQAKLYADMGLQVFFFAISIFGWYHWLKGGPAGSTAPVERTKRTVALTLFAICAVSIALMGYLLYNYTDASLPFWDSTTTVLSIAGQWMLARKYLENWLVWIVTDVIATGVYLYKGLYPTALLFTAFLIMATIGYIQWKKSLARQLT